MSASTIAETITTDPITLELFKNALFSIADEMVVTISRTTYSGVLRDNMDFPPALQTVMATR